MIRTTRGVTHYKGAGNRPEMMRVIYDRRGGLPTLTFEDTKEDYSFSVTVTAKVLEVLWEAIKEEELGNV